MIRARPAETPMSRLRERELHLTQEVMAANVGTTRTTLAKWEQGGPTPEGVVKILRWAATQGKEVYEKAQRAIELMTSIQSVTWDQARAVTGTGALPDTPKGSSTLAVMEGIKAESPDWREDAHRRLDVIFDSNSDYDRLKDGILMNIEAVSEHITTLGQRNVRPLVRVREKELRGVKKLARKARPHGKRESSSS